MNDSLPNSSFIFQERKKSCFCKQKNSLTNFFVQELESNKPKQEKITNIFAFTLELLNQGEENNSELKEINQVYLTSCFNHARIKLIQKQRAQKLMSEYKNHGSLKTN